MSEPANSDQYLNDVSEMMGWDEPRQIITEISGWVPLFDCVLQQYGNLTKAAVHGAVWRFCNMQDKVCRASLSNIGKKIGVDKATVMRYMKELCDDGYFVDLTPDLKNKPHVYAETGKVKMKNRFSVAQDNAGVAQNQLNKVFKKDSNKFNSSPEKPKPYDRAKGRQEALERKAAQRAKRGDPVDWLLANTGEVAEIDSMRRRVESALNKNLERQWDATNSEWNGYEKELIAREKESGETIEMFMEWFNEDDFRANNQRIWLKPSKIEELWPEAFSPSESSRNELVEIDPDTGWGEVDYGGAVT